MDISKYRYIRCFTYQEELQKRLEENLSKLANKKINIKGGQDFIIGNTLANYTDLSVVINYNSPEDLERTKSFLEEKTKVPLRTPN